MWCDCHAVGPGGERTGEDGSSSSHREWPLVIPCLPIQEVCYQYWPGVGSQRFGEFTVELLGEERLQGFVLRTLSAKTSQVILTQHLMQGYQAWCWVAPFLQSGSPHQVKQFHITNWAFDCCCSNLSTLTDVIERVARVQRRTGNRPIVIHCR